MNEFLHKYTCRLCQSTSLETVLDMGNSPIGEDFIFKDQIERKQSLYPVVLMRCCHCGQMQLSGVVDKTGIYTDYLYETTRSPGLDLHFQAYASNIMALPDVQQGMWCVDIGSNSGLLLHALHSQGMRVHGVEPAQRLADKATLWGVPTECCYFDMAFAKRFCAANGQASVITANNVFANIDDLDSVMATVNTLLTPDGYFIVETGYGLDLIQNFVIDNIYHEHISYFMLTPLNRYFVRHGLQIVRAERIPTKGGSLRIYARKAQLGQAADWSVNGLLALERELMFGSSIPFCEFATRAQGKKENALRAIEARMRKGAMAAFGAAVGCTTLLYWLELNENIDYIIDDNTLMHGRLSPGAHIPVYAPQHAYALKTPTILNLPWRYLSLIMQRHATYLDNGGCFLQVLPMPAEFNASSTSHMSHGG